MSYFRDLDSIVLYAHALYERAITPYDYRVASIFIHTYDIEYEYFHWFYTRELPSEYHNPPVQDYESWSEFDNSEDYLQDTYDF